MLASKILAGAGWMMSSRALSNVIGMLSTIIVARILLPEDFGIFAIAFSVMAIISAALELPASVAIIQMEDPSDEDFNSVFTVNLIRSGVLCLVLAGSAWPVAMIYGDDRLTWLMLALSVYPLILGFRNPYFEVYAHSVSFKPAAILEILSKVASFVASVGVALVYQSYWALVAGLFASAFASVLISFMFADGWPGLSLKSFKKIWSFSFWLGLASIVNQLNRQGDRLILGGFFTKTLLGYYALAGQIVEQLMFALINPINAAFYSGFSRMNGDLARIRNAYILSQQAVCTLLIPAGFGLAAVADTLIPIMLGERWAGAAVFVQFAAPSFSISLLCGPAWALAMSQARTRLLFFRDIYTMSIRLTIQVSGLLYAGLMGFLWAGILSSTINVFITMHMVWQICGLKISRQVLGTMRPLIAGGAMAGTVLLMKVNYAEQLSAIHPYASLGLQVFVGLLAYPTFLLALWWVQDRPEGVEQRGFEMARSIINSKIGRGEPVSEE